MGVDSLGMPANLVGAVKARRIIGGDLALSGVEGAVATSIAAASRVGALAHIVRSYKSGEAEAPRNEIQEAKCCIQCCRPKLKGIVTVAGVAMITSK